ncbi:MAG: class II SORL domain-containing protein [Candidatus Omnitrophota bacterium]
MESLKDMVQIADWKTEKHVPAIEIGGTVSKGEPVTVNVRVGKEIPHPNTTEHHIRWIDVYFKPDGSKFPYQLGKFEFTAHGESAQGPNTSTIYTNPQATVVFKTEKPGIIYATSYCNIHGLWENSIQITA